MHGRLCEGHLCKGRLCERRSRMLEQTLLLEATLYLSAGTANHDQTRRSASRSGQGRSIAFDKFRSYNYFQCHFALLRAQLNCARRSRMPINSETSPAATCAISTWRQVGMQHKSGSGGANWRCMVYADHRTHLLAEDVWAWCHPGSLPCNCKRNRPASLVAHCVSGPRPASPPHFPPLPAATSPACSNPHKSGAS